MELLILDKELLVNIMENLQLRIVLDKNQWSKLMILGLRPFIV